MAATARIAITGAGAHTARTRPPRVRLSGVRRLPCDRARALHQRVQRIPAAPERRLWDVGGYPIAYSYGFYDPIFYDAYPYYGAYLYPYPSPTGSPMYGSSYPPQGYPPHTPQAYPPSG